MVLNKQDVQALIEVLESHKFSVELRNGCDSQYWFVVEHDQEEPFGNDVNIRFERRRRRKKTKFLWEIIMRPDVVSNLAKSLKRMIKNEENYFNGK